jgi:hypothetical protein
VTVFLLKLIQRSRRRVDAESALSSILSTFLLAACDANCPEMALTCAQQATNQTARCLSSWPRPLHAIGRLVTCDGVTQTTLSVGVRVVFCNDVIVIHCSTNQHNKPLYTRLLPILHGSQSNKLLINFVPSFDSN